MKLVSDITEDVINVTETCRKAIRRQYHEAIDDEIITESSKYAAFFETLLTDFDGIRDFISWFIETQEEDANDEGD